MHRTTSIILSININYAISRAKTFSQIEAISAITSLDEGWRVQPNNNNTSSSQIHTLRDTHALTHTYTRTHAHTLTHTHARTHCFSILLLLDICHKGQSLCLFKKCNKSNQLWGSVLHRVVSRSIMLSGGGFSQI